VAKLRTGQPRWSLSVAPKYLRHSHHLFALGYGGNGMSVSFLAAQTLLRHDQDVATKDDLLFGFSR
jgi:hypothetical protein